MSYSDFDYSASDARREAAEDQFEEYVSAELDSLTGPVIRAVWAMDEAAYYPHPWTYERHLLSIWQEDGDDGLDEYLAEEYREEAEEAVRDRGDEGPCCFQFSCPCGNTNNRPD